MALLNEKNAFKFLDGLFLIIFVSTYLFPIVHLQRIIFMKKIVFFMRIIPQRAMIVCVIMAK